MAAITRKNVCRFSSIIFIAAIGCLALGCEVGSIEQPAANSGANRADNKSKRLNFVDANLKSDNINAALIANQINNTTAENANSAENKEINSSGNVEINNTVTAETSATPSTNPAKKPATDSRFDFAAAQNSNLSKNLTWTFGGKFQTGWYIYKPLLCHTIGVEIDIGDRDFAGSLASWQWSNGLPASGVLDRTTLNAFVAKWQANRLKTRGYPSPNALITTPTTDFYDVSRPDELRQVERDTFAAYKKLVAAAIADKSLNLEDNRQGELAPSEKFLRIVSAFRSREYQNKLRRETPNSGRAGLATGNSPHFTGRALDIYVGGEPVITKDENRAVQVNTKIYLWLVKNAEKFGFKPYFYEPWHWEYAPD